MFFSFTKVFSQNISSAFVSAPILCYGGFVLDSMRININQTPTPTQYKCLVGYHMNNTATPNTGVDFFLSYLSTQNTTANQLNFNGFLPNFLGGGNAGQTINYFVRIVDSTTYYPAHTFGNGASMVGVIDQFGPINFTEPSQLIVTLLSTDIANCSGLDDGTANAISSGGTPFTVGSSYNLLWTPGGQTTQTVVGLSAGAYTCTVIDSNGCTSSSTTIVNAPLYGCTDPLAYNYDPLPTCDDGSCIAVVNGCTDSLAFNYNPNANIDDGSCIPFIYGCVDVIACNYNVNANTDDGGCIYSTIGSTIVAACDSYTWDGIVYTVSGVYNNTYANAVGCDSIHSLDLTVKHTSTGSTSVTACDSYTWEGQTITLSDILSHTYIAGNSTGCDSIHTLSVLINNSTTSVVVDTACSEYLFGANLLDSSGIYIDTFLNSNNCDSIVTLELKIFEDSSVTYITVCDSAEWNGVWYYNDTTVTSAGFYTSYPFSLLIGCDSVATAIIDITNSSSTYTQVAQCDSFTWLINGQTYYTSQIDIVNSTNLDGCLHTDSLDLNISEGLNIAAIIDNIDCYGDSTGSINLTVSGGSLPYSFLWGNGTITEDVYNVSAGSISCYITDNSGCELTELFALTEEPPIQTNVLVNNVSCYGGNDGSASIIDISGGVYPYIIGWYGFDEDNLSEGIYLYEVIDNNSCIFQDSIYVSQEDSLDISIDVVDVNCTGNSEGEISISITSGGVSPFVFSWVGPNSFASSQEDIDNLYAGLYVLSLEDGNGCSSEFYITVEEPTSLSHYIGIETSNYSTYNISCHNGNDGWITVTPNGGYAPYSYLWSTGSTSSGISSLVAGTYDVTITNAIGCQESLVLSINEPNESLSAMPVSINDYNGYDISCFGGNDGAIIVEAFGGVSPYSYFWNNTIGFNSNIFLSAGVYNIEVIDNNNCSYFETIILDEPEVINWVIDVFPDTCEKRVGAVEVLLTGGVTPYSYEWNYSDILPFALQVPQGEYFIEFMDANLCSAYDTLYVDNLISPDANFVILPDYERLYQQLDDPIVFVDKTESVWQNVNSWLWDFGDYYFGYDSIAYHSYQEVGTYFVTLTIETEYGCIDTLTKEVIIAEYDLFIPNAFTPNPEDNINEGFKTHGIGIDEFLMNIYTRWGEVVFFTNDIEEVWDGKYNNKRECEVGVYLYYIEVKDVFGAVHKYEGQVNLIR